MFRDVTLYTRRTLSREESFEKIPVHAVIYRVFSSDLFGFAYFSDSVIDPFKISRFHGLFLVELFRWLENTSQELSLNRRFAMFIFGRILEKSQPRDDSNLIWRVEVDWTRIYVYCSADEFLNN